jgi:AcrR family transcriptional regulator
MSFDRLVGSRWKLRGSGMHDAEMDPTAGDGSRRILDAAEELFADRGFDAVSMHAIAQAAGISKANIYHYFPNKDALYLAVLRSASENLRALLQEAINSHGSVRDILHHFANSHLQALLKRPRLVRLVWREILEKGAPRAKELGSRASVNSSVIWWGSFAAVRSAANCGPKSIPPSPPSCSLPVMFFSFSIGIPCAIIPRYPLSVIPKRTTGPWSSFCCSG